MIESSIMSLKILTFNIFSYNGNLQLFITKFLNKINPDIICTQEDTNNDYVTPFGNNYKLIVKCGHCWSDCETVGIYYNINTVKKTDITSIRKLYTNSQEINVSRRNAIIVNVKGITIANLHLEGGRYIDKELLDNPKHYFNEYLKYKSSLINDILAENPNIICGDFNSIYSENEMLYSKYLGNQFKYFNNLLESRDFTINDKLNIKNWNDQPYKLLKKQNYIYISPENESKCITSSRGNSIIDGFWLNENMKKTKYSSKIINLGDINEDMLLGSISDHNPVLLNIYF